MSDNANHPLNDKSKTPEQVADELGVPVIPPRADPWKQPSNDPNPTVAVCGQCGLQIKRTMHYSCPHPDCPCSIKVTMKA